MANGAFTCWRVARFIPLANQTSQGENAFLWGSQRVLGPYDFAMPGTAIVQGIARFALAKSVTLALLTGHGA
jgi:hypothetical protein